MQFIKIDVNYKTLRMDPLKRFAQRGRRAMISGLDDVVVAETVLSDVDGQAGRLVIRGHSLDDLVDHASFECVLASAVGRVFQRIARAGRADRDARRVSRRVGELSGNFGAFQAPAISQHIIQMSTDAWARPDSAYSRT